MEKRLWDDEDLQRNSFGEKEWWRRSLREREKEKRKEKLAEKGSGGYTGDGGGVIRWRSS